MIIVIVLAVYRPPNNDLVYAQALCKAFQYLILENPLATFWISGDFNLPVIDWSTETIIGHQYNVALNNCFLTTLTDLPNHQVVDFPTRNNNTL